MKSLCEFYQFIILRMADMLSPYIPAVDIVSKPPEMIGTLENCILGFPCKNLFKSKLK